MGDIQRVLFSVNEQLIASDGNLIGSFEFDNIGEVLQRYLISNDGVFSGLDILADFPTSMNVFLQPGSGLQGASNVGKPLIVQAQVSVTIPTAHPTLNRIDIIQAQYIEDLNTPQSRVFIIPSSGITFNASTNTRARMFFAVGVKQGTSGASPVAPVKDVGFIKLGEVLVTAGTTQITNANIKDVDNADTWTTEPKVSRRLQTLVFAPF